MRIAMALLATSLMLGTIGCKKNDKGEVGTSAGSGEVAAGSAVGSGSAGSAAAGDTTGSAADPAASAPMSNRGGNCPSTVFGSTTTAKLEGGKIVVTVTADDPDAIAAIQKRSSELLAGKASAGGRGAGHDQKGTQGGTMGLCPVHLGDGGTATSTPDPKGVVVTIMPAGDPAALKAEVDARIARSAEWVKANVKDGDKGTTGGVGGGKGEHGSNHSGEGDGKGAERKGGDGKGGGAGTGGGGGAGTGGGGGKGTSGDKSAGSAS